MLNDRMGITRGARRLHTIKCRAIAFTIVIGLLISLVLLTSCNTATPSPPSRLVVSPTQIEISSSCCSSNNVICRSHAVVSLHDSGQNDLPWSAAAQISAGWSLVFTPAKGALSAGQTAPVHISFNGGACPAQATLTFTGPANTVSVHWECAETNQP
jgi:hypothetical protein